MIDFKKIVGDISDIRCRGNSIKLISRVECRNSCKCWNNRKRKCVLGY